MKMKWIGQILALSAFAAFTAVCSRDELEDETEDVVEAQREAAKVAEEKSERYGRHPRSRRGSPG